MGSNTENVSIWWRHHVCTCADGLSGSVMTQSGSRINTAPSLEMLPFSWMTMLQFRFKFYLDLCPMTQMAIIQHWLKTMGCREQATGHYLKQWWPSWCARICVILVWMSEEIVYNTFFCSEKVYNIPYRNKLHRYSDHPNACIAKSVLLNT